MCAGDPVRLWGWVAVGYPECGFPISPPPQQTQTGVEERAKVRLKNTRDLQRKETMISCPQFFEMIEFWVGWDEGCVVVKRSSPFAGLGRGESNILDVDRRPPNPIGETTRSSIRRRHTATRASSGVLLPGRTIVCTALLANDHTTA